MSIDNPSLRQIPRHEPAEVIPINRDTSILDWLLSSGRLIPREEEDSESLLATEGDLDVLEEDVDSNNSDDSNYSEEV